MSEAFTGLERGRRKPARSKGGVAGVIGLVLGMTLAGIVTIGIGYAMWKGATAPSATAPAPRKSREEFRASLMGKSPEAVIKAIGKPSSADEAKGEDQHMTWLYSRGMTFDPVSQTNDGSVFVYFERGKVVKVTY